MKLRCFTIVLPLVFFLVSGCGTSGTSRKGSATPPEEQERPVPLSQYEKAFNPSDYNDEIDAVQKQHELEQQRAAAEHQRDSVVVESEFSQGFRIQIFATGSIDEANAMRMTAVQRIPEDSVYVVFDPPVYKVRVGDFKTKTEANQRLGVIAGLGFTDAWIVSDKIIQSKLVRLQQGNPPRKH